MSSTGRVGCHAARAGRLVAARAIALAAANAWAITGLILVTGVVLRAAPSGPTRLKAVQRTCFKLAAQKLGSVYCMSGRPCNVGDLSAKLLRVAAAENR